MTQAGVLVRAFPSPHGAGGAAVDDAGRLFVVDEDTGTIRRIDLSDGTVAEEVFPIRFVGRLAAADFDPVTGHLFAYAEATEMLVEVDVATGEVLSAIDMTPFLVNGTFATGLAFNADGTKLYFISGSVTESVSVIDVSRAWFHDSFELGDFSKWQDSAP